LDRTLYCSQGLPFIGDDLELASTSYLDAFFRLSKAVINGMGLSLSDPS
jgi:hypothetical protein